MYLFYGLSIFLLLGALLPSRRQGPYIVLSFIILCFISAYRDISVGTDTATYESIFNNLNSEFGLIYYDRIEPAWILLNDMVLKFGGDFRHVLIASSLLTLCPLFLIAKKYSYNPMLTISLYYLLYFYIFSLNITRQLIAVSFILFSIILLLKGKKKLFLLIVVLASLFHTSALIALLLIFYRRFPSDLFLLILFISIAMLSGVFGVNYISLITSLTKYASYTSAIEFHSLVPSIIFLLIFNCFFILISFTSDRSSDYFKIFFIFAIAMNLSIRFPFGSRLLMYFSIFQILFYPYYLATLGEKNKKIKLPLTIFVILYSYTIYIRAFGDGQILPYINILF